MRDADSDKLEKKRKCPPEIDPVCIMSLHVCTSKESCRSSFLFFSYVFFIVRNIEMSPFYQLIERYISAVAVVVLFSIQGSRRFGAESFCIFVALFKKRAYASGKITGNIQATYILLLTE